MMETAYDWSSFVVRVNIKSPKEQVYKMWASMYGMECWFLRLCAYKKNAAEWYGANELVQPGAAYTMMWYGWDDNTKQHGEIITANGIDLFEFTFQQKEAEDMYCTIQLSEECGETICALTQSKIPTTEIGKTHYHIECMKGWVFYLSNLKSILEGGLDMRNQNVLLKKIITC